jgi:hypothetical protein
MNRSRVVQLSWVVAVSFILAVGLALVDRLNLVATPPELPESNMVERSIATVAYRQAIWPVFLWTNLLYAVGFVAVVAFAGAIVGSLGRRLAVFAALAGLGGTIGAIAGVIPIGSVESAVWLGYCDCGFKEQEIVSQIWASMVAQDISDWLLRAAGVTLAVSMVVLVRDARDLVSPALRAWSYLTAAALIVAPMLSFVSPERLGDIADLLSAGIAGILVPVWAIWVGRSIDRSGVTMTATA